MEKLKLTVEALEVTTFEMADAGEPRGTVAAHDAISGTRPTCKTCLTNITCCTPMI